MKVNGVLITLVLIVINILGFSEVNTSKQLQEKVTEQEADTAPNVIVIVAD